MFYINYNINLIKKLKNLNINYDIEYSVLFIAFIELNEIS